MRLIDEAIAIEEKLMVGWDPAASVRYDEIQRELEQPYAHFFHPRRLGSVGAGWWPELFAALDKIKLLMEHHPDYAFTLDQVKEKFGLIRFYFSITKKTAEPDWSASEDSKQKIYEQVRFIVKELEVVTSQKCEICGEHGTLRGGGWMKTMCDKHELMRHTQGRHK